MSSIELFTLIIALSYFLFILLIIYGFFKQESKSGIPTTPNNIENGISILVPFKDEEKNLPSLLNALSLQNYPKGEIIFINDHSLDGSLNKLNEFTHPRYNVKILHLLDEEFGKKTAIEKGLAESEFENILTIDADCTFSEDFISIHASALKDKRIVNTGVVTLSERSGFWNKFQLLEMTAIQSVGIGLGKIGWPISMSGANLSYHKSVFNELRPYDQNKKTLSGDDIYFLQSLKRNGIKIRFLNNIESQVVTLPQTFSGYFRQRIRWMKKSSSFADWTTLVSGLIIFISAAQFIFITGYQVFTQEWNHLLLISVGLKMVVDFLLLFLVTHHWKKSRWMIWFLPVFLINVFLIAILPIIGWWIPVTWKGRKI